MVKVDTSVAQMRKGVLEMCVLAIISIQEAYASDIIDKLKHARLIVVEGTLYPILTRLKNDAYLTYRWEESNAGPPRKYYTITPEGNQFLDELKSGWSEMVDAVNQIIVKEMKEKEVSE
jgi:PadR family transcriptional regulator PadR